MPLESVCHIHHILLLLALPASWALFLMKLIHGIIIFFARNEEHNSNTYIITAYGDILD